MKKPAALLLCLVLALSLAPVRGALASESLYIKKVVSVVYDDSGSMGSAGARNWAYANYAIQAMCALLNDGDEMYITYMSDPRECEMPDGFTTDRQRAVDNIRKRIGDGNTPEQAIFTAHDKLTSRFGELGAANTEYWLVILTDGYFNGDSKNTFDEAALNSVLVEYARDASSAEMKLSTVYLAIGDQAIKAAGDDALNITAMECLEGKDVFKAISSISDKISGRYRLDPTEIVSAGDNSVTVTSRIPLSNICVLVQNADVELTLAEAAGVSLDISRSVRLRYPEKRDWETDRTLNGMTAMIARPDGNIPAGTYTLSFSGPVEPGAIDVMFEPALALSIYLYKDGARVEDITTLREGDVISAQAVLTEAGTNDPVDISGMIADTGERISCTIDGALIKSAGALLLEDILLEPKLTAIQSSVTIEGFAPLDATLEFTPGRAAVYTLDVTPDEGVSIDVRAVRETGDTSDAQLRFIILADGLPIPADGYALHQTDFTISDEHGADARSLFSIIQEDTGYAVTYADSLSRLLVKYFPYFIRGGVFTVTGTIENGATASASFTINPFILTLPDDIELLIPWLILLGLLFIILSILFKRRLPNVTLRIRKFVPVRNGYDVQGGDGIFRLSALTLHPFRARKVLKTNGVNVVLRGSHSLFVPPLMTNHDIAFNGAALGCLFTEGAALGRVANDAERQNVSRVIKSTVNRRTGWYAPRNHEQADRCERATPLHTLHAGQALYILSGASVIVIELFE